MWERQQNRGETLISMVTHLLQRGDEEHGQRDQMQHGEEDQQEDHGCLQGEEESGVLCEACMELHWVNKRLSCSRRNCALSSRSSRSAATISAHTPQTTSMTQQFALKAGPVPEDNIRASALCNHSKQ